MYLLTDILTTPIFLTCSMRNLRFGETKTKVFSIVEEQPGLEDDEFLEVLWLECNFPPCTNLKNIKSSIDNIKHKWQKEIFKKAEHPFEHVINVTWIYIVYNVIPVRLSIS